MTKTVKEIVDEYKNRQENAMIEELLIRVGDQTLCFKEVVNFKQSEKSQYSFDYNDAERIFNKSTHEVDSRPCWKHIDCTGTILLKKGAIGEGF